MRALGPSVENLFVVAGAPHGRCYCRMPNANANADGDR